MPLAVQMAARGFSADKFHVTGIPVQERFAVRAAEPLAGEVLVMGGGLGFGPTSDIVSALTKVTSIDHITVVCGHNQELKEEISKTYAKEPVTVLGFTPDVDQLMAKAALLVTKPGALTACEALCLGIPMLLVDAMGGQEEDNASYLEESGVALTAIDMPDVARLAQLILTQPSLQAVMKTQCSVLAKPNAARDAADIIIKALE